jgi:hypothetical protein
MSFNTTDKIVMPVIIIVGSLIGYIWYRNEINSEGKNDHETIGETVKSIFTDAKNTMTFAGGSATRRKKHRRNKSHKKH